MPRPQPLKNLSTAVSNPDDNSQLTPRTPFSRTARLEGGFARLQVTEVDDFDDGSTFAQQQSAPLLASSRTSRFSAGLGSSKDEPKSAREPLTPMSRTLAYFGVALAVVLLFLIGLSYTNNDMLMRYMGLKSPGAPHAQSSSHAASHAAPSSSGKPTISYANYTRFPLTGAQYRDECQKQMGVFMSHGDYWDHFHNHTGAVDTAHSDDPKICKSTITYLLDGHVGLAADLALMAQVAALARERNRTFFIDDTHWNRGWWSEYFEGVAKLQPGPEPGCKRPSPEELVACPRTARHWVVTSLTAKYHLGHEFDNHYENAYKHELNRQKPIFTFAEQSFSSTIRPSKEMTNLIQMARNELVQLVPTDASPDEPFITDGHTTATKYYISVHIRRGDRIPQGWAYHRKPIPIKEYLDGVVGVFNRSQTTRGNLPSPKSVPVYVASDSPFDLQEFDKVYRDGPVYSLARSTHRELKDIVSPNEYYQAEFSSLSADARRRATTGALVDLALVTGLWGEGQQQLRHHSAVVTASSNFGRLAAIGLGWDNAFGGVDEMGNMDNAKKRWVDVDMKGSELPVWKPFEIF